MTKKQLIEMIESFSDDADVCVFWRCSRCDSDTLEEVVDLCENGPSIQLNAESIHEDE